jgi:hypothetical protein
MNSRIHHFVLVSCLLLASSATLAVGPPKSTERDSATAADANLPPVTTHTRLDVIIPVFDPGLGEMPKPYHKDDKWDQVWPEVRRAEANLFAVRIKETLEKTGVFGAVRVAPNEYAIGEVYVLGRIMRSNTEETHLEVEVMDITESVWVSKRIYKYRIDGDQLAEGARLRGIYPNQPLFDAIAEDVVQALAARDEQQLEEIVGVADMVFASSYSAETFGDYLEVDRDGQRRLRGLPAQSDPQYRRIASVRAREELFIDDLQGHYETFAANVEQSYAQFQRQGHPIAVEARETRATANRNKAFAGLAALGALVIGNQVDAPVKEIGLAAGGVMAYQAFRQTNEFKSLTSSLGELGDSVDLQLAPQNVEFEGQTTELSGNASEQFDDIRRFLHQVYEEESTPDVDL